MEILQIEAVQASVQRERKWMSIVKLLLKTDLWPLKLKYYQKKINKKITVQ
jgi:hypothetical protein